MNKNDFLKEARVMMNLNHLYIVKFIGVCHGPPVAMVSNEQFLMIVTELIIIFLDHKTRDRQVINAQYSPGSRADGHGITPRQSFGARGGNIRRLSP